MTDRHENGNGVSGEHGQDVRDEVAEYYGKVLSSSADLKTNACCTDQAMSRELKTALSKIHDEVMMKYYGCGLIAPELLEGCTVVDLGCGAGRDCYALAQFVGERGRVIGVDMTEEQLCVARKHVQFHARKFGYAKPNTEFLQGYIEKLDALGLEENSVDVIVSNCVVNLSPDKLAVLKQAYRILKNGGEMYFSDVYASRRVPKELVSDPVLFGECLSGSLYYNDFVRLANKAGFVDARVVKSSQITIQNPEIENKLGAIKFYSVTYRLFKLDALETLCEDYGQAVRYKGTIPACPVSFELDNHHSIEKGRMFPVCGNTYLMLHESRFRPHFEFFGDFSTHYGIFDGCGDSNPFESASAPSPPGADAGCC